MNLEQVYYASELLGLVAVIASLLYVGRQVKQNTASMRNAASTEYLNGLNALTIAMAMNRDFAEIWTKGANEFEQPDDVWNEQVVGIQILSQRQSVRFAWATFSHTFKSEFREVVDRHMQPQPDPA